jgi:molybdopterin molybdotransferase
VLDVETAQARVLERLAPMGREQVLLGDAHGRVLAEDVVAGRALPPWDNSAMDGYAVRAADCGRAGVTLRVVGVVAAGHAPAAALEAGTAVRIMTGAPVPAGADAIVMREYAEAIGEGAVRIDRAAQLGEHIRRRGDDVREGETVLAGGTALGPGELGLCAALGRAQLAVHARPRVAIVSTGDELVEIDEVPGPGQIVNSNAYALAAMIREAGGLPWVFPNVADQPEALRAAFEQALAADAIVSTGGVSVGEFDYVKDAMSAVGLALDFWKVAMKPGKPVAFGMAGRRPGFGLPGNPASSMVSFELFVRPALRAMAGRKTGLFRPRAEVVFEGTVQKGIGRRHFIRAELRRDGPVLSAKPNARQGSGMLRSMVGVGALVEIGETVTEVTPGTRLPALLLSDV